MTKHYLISGQVQGVGFRSYTERVARSLDLTGWVRNLTDGRVEALVSGGPDSLEKLEARLQKGPPPSEVTQFNVETVSEEAHYESFNVVTDGAQPWREH